MNLARRAAVPAAVFLLLTGLTGCAHQSAPSSAGQTSSAHPTSSAGQTSSAHQTGAVAAPTSAAPAPASTADPLNDVASDLNGADGAMSQAGSDLSAGDWAASRSDTP
jgi:predicted lipid-binding transport protein (Tim44 family)